MDVSKLFAGEGDRVKEAMPPHYSTPKVQRAGRSTSAVRSRAGGIRHVLHVEAARSARASFCTLRALGAGYNSPMMRKGHIFPVKCVNGITEKSHDRK